MRTARSSTALAWRIPLRNHRSWEGDRRRGVVLLVVVLMVATTLALSYAVVRSQFTTLQIQRNSGRRTAARQAAITGLTMAIKKMHTSGWNGVDTTLTGSLGLYESFEVAFTGGDPSLSSGDPDYGELPYRVTLLATGYAADPDNPQCIALHRVRAVLCLVPRALAEEPTDWATMQQYTVYQSKSDSLEFDIPCRIEGPVRVQGQLRIAIHYPNDNNAWSRYLEDLNAMRLAGQPDYRPLNGPVDLPFLKQTGDDLSALAFNLKVQANDRPTREAASDWVSPTSLVSYQVYEGGPMYTIPALGETLENTVLEPDPLSNPLGIYYRAGNLIILDNVTIRGSVFCRDEIRIEGTNVRFESFDLPAPYGSDAPVRLPAVSCNKFKVRPIGGGSLDGFTAVFDEFRVEKSPETVQFAITGRTVTRRLHVDEREPWNLLDWSQLYSAFLEQPGGAEPVVAYFPVWMGNQGRDPRPRLTIKPGATVVAYHWKKRDDPVYVPHPNDGGLRWDLWQWTDDP